MKNNEIDNVLKYQKVELEEINGFDKRALNQRIDETEALLDRLGYSLPSITKSNKSKSEIVIPEWNSLVSEAVEVVGTDNRVDDLFNSDELIQNSVAVKAINHDFKQIYKLDKYDYAICVCSGLLAAATDILFVGIPKPGVDGTEAGSLSDWIRERFHDMIPDEKIASLETSTAAKVPFDAQDNRNTAINVGGLSAYYHRLLEIGHDPLLGFVVGVYDIMHGTMTTIDKNGFFVNQLIHRLQADCIFYSR